MSKNLRNKLDKLKAGIGIFTPIYVYIFLKMLELSKQKKDMEAVTKEIEKSTEGLIGRPYSQWPEVRKKDFNRLAEILWKEKWVRLYAEVIYFLIFTISGYSYKYIDQQYRVLILDSLFEIFDDLELWIEGQPEEDAYNKYAQAKISPLEKFSHEIARISGLEDEMFLALFCARVTIIFKFFIAPAIDRIFSNHE